MTTGIEAIYEQIVQDIAERLGGNDDDKPEIYHLYCHDPDKALCGEDLTDELEVEFGDEHQICVVCDDLDNYTCEECGE